MCFLQFVLRTFGIVETLYRGGMFIDCARSYVWLAQAEFTWRQVISQKLSRLSHKTLAKKRFACYPWRKSSRRKRTPPNGLDLLQQYGTNRSPAELKFCRMMSGDSYLDITLGACEPFFKTDFNLFTASS